MKESLIEKKAQLQTQMDRVDKAILFFEQHPEMETMLGAFMALTGYQTQPFI